MVSQPRAASFWQKRRVSGIARGSSTNIPAPPLRQLVIEKAAQLGPERVFLLCKGEVHRSV
jgi:hypothetical protein